jgi:hypothetical protein
MPFYTSRSAIQSAMNCRRKRWLNYHYNGKGIVTKSANVPYITGTSVHKGPEYLLREYQQGRIVEFPTKEQLENGIKLALGDYEKLIISATEETDKAKYEQQKYLTEALIRAWSYVELPVIMKYFDVLAVEQDIEVPLGEGVILESKADAILKRKTGNEVFPYSIKTMRRFDEKKTKANFDLALQTVLEAYATRHLLSLVGSAYNVFMDYAQASIKSDRHFSNLSSFCRMHLPNPSTLSVVGTKHCFLVKGTSKQDDSGNWVSDSPLISGYYNEEKGEYTPKWRIPNGNYKSGYSTLGKGWSYFNVWEKTSIEQWIECLEPDIIKESVIVPPTETWIVPEEMECRVRQVQEQEQNVQLALSVVDPTATHGTRDRMLDKYFPQNTDHCLFPVRCDYYEICHLRDWKADGVNIQIRADPTSNGYQWRVPHHKLEKGQHET